jgi:hypothetical protein
MLENSSSKALKRSARSVFEPPAALLAADISTKLHLRVEIKFVIQKLL